MTALVALALLASLEEGEAYLEVGLAEMRAGSWDTAAIALERATRLLPKSAPAAAALGTAYARLDRLNEAERELRRARALGDDSAPTLLELGVLLVRRGRSDEALEPLEAARRRAPNADLAQAASFFRALAYLRLGDRDAAHSGFAAIERSGGRFADDASRMTELSRPLSRLTLSLTVRGEYDSNALLLPSTPSTVPLPSPERDAALFVAAGVRGRPLPGVDLVLRDDVVYRKLVHVDELDLFGNVAGLDWRHAAGRHTFIGSYQLDYHRLAQQPYLLANRVSGGYEVRLGEGVRLAASLALQVRRFRQAAFEPFSGEGYHARVSAILWGAPSQLTLEVGYGALLEVTEELDLGFHGHAPFATFFWQPRRWLTLSVGVEIGLRFFLAVDDAFGETRREIQPVAWGALELRPYRPWRLVLAASWTHNAARPAFYAFDRTWVGLASVLEVDAF